MPPPACTAARPRSRGRASAVAVRRGLALLLAVGAAACSREGGGRPGVLLVTIDTLRADHVSAYGYPRATSPHIDAIAADGTLFTTAYAPASATGPSHASLFTSRYPLGHGVVRNALPLDARIPTLASVLSAAGYRTAAFVSSYPVSSAFGFAHGFAHYDEDFARGGGTLASRHWQEERGDRGALDRRAAATVDRARAWLARQEPGPPLFVWVHLFDPHAPYAPPPPYDGAFGSAGAPPRQRAIDLYDGEIRYADEQLGRLVDAFDRATRATGDLVVITADHGEGLWDHGYPGHNRGLYEEEVRVPLILRWRGHVPAGRRSDAPAELVDVQPTVLAACRVAAPAGAVGKDLLRALGDPALLPADRPIYLTRPYFGARGRKRRLNQVGWSFAVRRGTWKLIEARDEGWRVLYDLAHDPEESVNEAATNPALASELSGLLQSWREHEPTLLSDDALEVPRRVRRRLRALGYAD